MASAAAAGVGRSGRWTVGCSVSTVMATLRRISRQFLSYAIDSVRFTVRPCILRVCHNSLLCNSLISVGHRVVTHRQRSDCSNYGRMSHVKTTYCTPGYIDRVSLALFLSLSSLSLSFRSLSSLSDSVSNSVSLSLALLTSVSICLCRRF